jgi:hypothetical protein
MWLVESIATVGRIRRRPFVAIAPLLLILMPVQGRASCQGIGVANPNAPILVIQNRILQRSIISDVTVPVFQIPYANTESLGSGAYIMYKLDDEPPLYVSPGFGRELVFRTPQLSVGMHAISVGLIASGEIVKSLIYCLTVQ